MEMRKWLMEQLDYALENHIEMIDIINNTSDESLQDILDTHFAECIFNIQTNYTFLRMIITRKKANHIAGEPDESIMANDELDKFIKEHVNLLIGLIPII
jgi:hypothetical protein